METTRRQERRRERHVRRLAQYPFHEAGTPSDIGEALDRCRSAVAHWKTDRMCPELRDAANVLIRLAAHPKIDLGPFLEIVDELRELEDITTWTDERLVAEAMELMEAEDYRSWMEDQATLRRRGQSNTLRARARVSLRLAPIMDEAEYRGIDLYTLYDERAVAA